MIHKISGLKVTGSEHVGFKVFTFGTEIIPTMVYLGLSLT